MALAILLVGAAFALKWWYRSATAEDLTFVLEPVSILVSALTGASSMPEADGSYLFPELAIRIDRSCSGINFLAIATACFALVILKRSDGGCARPLLAVLAAGGAYLLTIAVNSGRIAVMAFAKQGGLHLAPRAHEAVGAFFFLGALLVAVLLLNRLMHRTDPA
ncbi:MAG: exosortase K [Flavobacteriales bacterium]|jgi:exosortase K|nr:exosortase K [Flavobacteriales bacterium]